MALPRGPCPPDHVTSNGALTTCRGPTCTGTGLGSPRAGARYPLSAASVGSTPYLFLPARVWMYDPGWRSMEARPGEPQGRGNGRPDGLIRVFSCTRYDVFDANEEALATGPSSLYPAVCSPRRARLLQPDVRLRFVLLLEIQEGWWSLAMWWWVISLVPRPGRVS